MSFTPPPRPDHELLAWARTNRKDMVFYLEQLFKEMPSTGQRGDAMLLLIASAFTAGRWFQKVHGDQGNLFGENPYKK